MDLQVLKAIRTDFKNEVSEIQSTKMLLEEINRLKKDPAVVAYLAKLEQLEEVDYDRIINQDEKDILFSVFNRHIRSTEKTNQIYFCFGTFRNSLQNEYNIEHGPHDIRLTREDPNAEFRIYIDIESSESLRINIDKCKEFEYTHKVIIPKSPLVGMNDFYKIQKEFITTTIRESEAAACEFVMKRKY